jgi:chemotaxis protein methyltransferase CheR
MISENNPIELTVEAHGGMTTSSEGISLGLITAELVINALKHAFPSKKPGNKITVLYEVNGGGGWRLSVSDNGIGIIHDPTRKEGLGTTIVESLARQLRATVDVRTSPKGTTVSIERILKAVVDK